VETEESAVFGLLYSIPGCCVARDVQQHLCVEGGGRERERESEREARERGRQKERERKGFKITQTILCHKTKNVL
jgi:hypothetical protein